MGCFSVSCGITRLTINAGEECCLLPLVPPQVFEDGQLKENNYGIVPPTSYFVYNTDVWRPFCLPIFGKYNEYGSLSDIVKDENTRHIEEKLGIDIETFVKILTDNRDHDFYDTYCIMNKVFFINPKLLDYNTSIEEMLSGLGFNKSNNNSYILGDDFTLIKEPNSNKYILKRGKSEKTIYDNADVLREYENAFGKKLGLREDRKKLYKIVSRLGGMFVLKSAYDFYAKKPSVEDFNHIQYFDITKMFITEIGFKMIKDHYEKEVNGKNLVFVFEDSHGKLKDENVYDIEDFVKIYEEITDVHLDLSRYKGIDKFEWYKINQKYDGYDKIVQIVKTEAKYFDDIPIDMNDKNSVCEYIDKKPYILGFSSSEDSFVYGGNYFHKYKELKNNYLNKIIRGEILEDYYNFMRFDDAIGLSNIIYMPTYAGTQCGCLEAENKLAYITQKIVNNRISILKEEWNEDAISEWDLNPNHGFDRRFY